MIVVEKGKYKVLKDFTTRNSVAIGTLLKDTFIEITQVDNVGHKVISSDFFDWMPDNLPLEKVK